MKCLVTGARGFLGRHLMAELKRLNWRAISDEDYRAGGMDLSRGDWADRLIRDASLNGRLDVVFHLAGYNGGIAFNAEYPADIFRVNTAMALNVLDACYKQGAGGVVSVVPSCGYASAEDFLEENYLEGRPDPTVACHGYAKRNLLLASQFYKAQYGLQARCACQATMYGPGDRFNPLRSKVVAGLVKKFVDARRQGSPKVTLWGTGAASREFLYVGDFAKLLPEIARSWHETGRPLNVSDGKGVTVAELAGVVARAARYDGEIEWDHSRPDGQMKRHQVCDSLRAIGGVEFTPLQKGVEETVRWYEENRD